MQRRDATTYADCRGALRDPRRGTNARRSGLIGWLGAVVAFGLSGCTSASNGRCVASGSCNERTESTDSGPSPTPSANAAACGDGVLDPGEECDDGSACADGRSCTDDRYRCDGTSRASCRPRGGDGCSAACTLEPSAACESLDRVGMGCTADEMIEPSLPLDEMPSRAPTPPEAGGNDDTGSEPLDESDTASEPPGCELGEFGVPEPIAGLIPSPSIWAPALAADGQTLYFAASSASLIEAIYSAKRVGQSQVSETAVLSALDSGAGDGTPYPSFDGLSLYFYSQRTRFGDRDLWQATRPDRASTLADPSELLGINTDALDHLPWVSPDESTLLFVSTRAGGLGASDIWISTRPTRNLGFGPAQPLDGVNSPRDEGRAVMSRDGLTLFFSSARDGTEGDHDLWTATRSDAGLAFGSARNLSALNTAGRDMDPFLSANERELWFASDRDGNVTLWRAVRACTD